MSIQAPQGPTQKQIRSDAEAWFKRQHALLKQVFAPNWMLYQSWLEESLKDELRDRLIAAGRRSKP